MLETPFDLICDIILDGIIKHAHNTQTTCLLVQNHDSSTFDSSLRDGLSTEQKSKKIFLWASDIASPFLHKSIMCIPYSRSCHEYCIFLRHDSRLFSDNRLLVDLYILPNKGMDLSAACHYIPKIIGEMIRLRGRCTAEIKVTIHLCPVIAVNGSGSVEQGRQQVLLDVADIAARFLHTAEYIFNVRAVQFLETLYHQFGGNLAAGNGKVMAMGRRYFHDQENHVIQFCLTQGFFHFVIAKLQAYLSGQFPDIRMVYRFYLFVDPRGHGITRRD